MRNWMAAGAGVAIAAVVLVAILQAAVWPTGESGRTGTTACETCSQVALVVDVVMPVLGTSGNLTNPNRVVNLSLGETKTFEVDVYPTAGLDFVMSFRSVLISGGSGGQSSGSGANITAYFQPSTLNVVANEKGATSMTVSVPQGAERGTYDAVVSATNRSNSSQVWGLYFEIAAT